MAAGSGIYHITEAVRAGQFGGVGCALISVSHRGQVASLVLGVCSALVKPLSARMLRMLHATG